MLLTIDETKVAELLLATDKVKYKVSTSDLPEPPVESKNYGPPSCATSGTVYTAPLLVTAETKERLMALRREIEESGVRLKSAEDLTREIDEMRGRR